MPDGEGSLTLLPSNQRGKTLAVGNVTKSGVQVRVMPVYQNQEDMSDGRRIALIKEFT